MQVVTILWIRSVINKKSFGCILSSGNWVSTKLVLSGIVLSFKISKHRWGSSKFHDVVHCDMFFPAA
ncbi:unnamed protein product [Malus baccata var. baccata]